MELDEIVKSPLSLREKQKDEKIVKLQGINDASRLNEPDERAEYLKRRLTEEIEFRCTECHQIFKVAGRSLWAPYTCKACSSLPNS